MRWSSRHRALLLATALAVNAGAGARPQTVCTITVNSPEEKQSFARHLPADRARFVELVERGRPDWLATACQASIACDVLVISGHYDGDNEFFSDRLDVNEHLPVSELERASCSDTCPALFSRLKEVYLFGCNTLNPQPQSSASADIVRSLVRMCEEMHIQVIGEGVETVGERDALRDAGVYLMQGYLFARPAFQAMAAVEFGG